MRLRSRRFLAVLLGLGFAVVVILVVVVVPVSLAPQSSSGATSAHVGLHLNRSRRGGGHAAMITLPRCVPIETRLP